MRHQSGRGTMLVGVATASQPGCALVVYMAFSAIAGTMATMMIPGDANRNMSEEQASIKSRQTASTA